jgi:VanZ family protein
MMMLSRLVKSWLTTLAAFCMLAALFIGGAQHGAGSLFAAPWDKMAHIVFFFSLTLFLVSGLRFSMVTTTLSALLIGILDELHQIWLPGRVPSLDDWLADVVGVLLAIGLIYFRKRH